MNQSGSLLPDRENVFLMVGSSARHLSYGALSGIAAASGVIALAAAASGRASWMLLTACYVAWCFAGWGILFHSSTPATTPWRLLRLTIAASAATASVAIGVGIFFWALGPSWVL